MPTHPKDNRSIPISKKSGNAGFTLMELLVVTAIISLLSSLVLASLSQVRASARDAQRVHDFQQLQTAMELFLDENDAYPGSGFQDGQISENCKTNQLYNDLIGDGYLPRMPSDPAENFQNCTAVYSNAGTSEFFYAYDWTNNGGDRCIIINNFETNDDGGEISEYNQVGDRSFGGEANATEAEFVHCFKD